jgi:hypothetical protein
MAFAVLQDTTTGSVSGANNYDIDYPATVNSGDFLLFLSANDLARGLDGFDTAGWTVLTNPVTSYVSMCVAYKYCDGTETGTFNVQFNPSAYDGLAWHILRYTGVANPAVQPPEAPWASAGGDSTNPDPITTDAPTGGAKDYTFIAVVATDYTTVPSASPTGYGAAQYLSSGNGDATLIYAIKEENKATAEDPDVFTIDIAEQWRANTVILHPETTSTATPVITDVNTDEIVELGSSGNVVTGTDFGTTGEVRINTQSDGLGTDLATTETSQSDTSITFYLTVGLPPGTAYLFVHNGTNENATGFAITLTVPSGYESFVYDGTSQDPVTTESIQEDAAKEPTDGYGFTMIGGETVIIETTSAVWAVDGTYEQVTPTNETAPYYIWDPVLAIMHGESGPVSITLAVEPTLTNPSLTSPTETTLVPGCTTDYAGDTWYWHVGTSSTPITSYSDIINGVGADDYGSQTVTTVGDLTDLAEGLSSGTTYYLNACQENGGVYSEIVTSSGVATSAGVDITPDQFTFADQTDVVRSTVVTSNTITVTGVDAGEDVPLTITDGEYSINGGAWASTATNVQLNDEIQVRHTSSASYSTAVDTTLDLNGVSDVFTSTTEANVAPDIDDQQFNVFDGSQPGKVIGTIHASDPNNDAIDLTILSGNTNSDLSLTLAGVLSVANTLDQATTAIYNLVVQADDGLLQSTANITINVVDPVEMSDAGKITQPIFDDILERIFKWQ